MPDNTIQLYGKRPRQIEDIILAMSGVDDTRKGEFEALFDEFNLTVMRPPSKFSCAIHASGPSRQKFYDWSSYLPRPEPKPILRVLPDQSVERLIEGQVKALSKALEKRPVAFAGRHRP